MKATKYSNQINIGSFSNSQYLTSSNPPGGTKEVLKQEMINRGWISENGKLQIDVRKLPMPTLPESGALRLSKLLDFKTSLYDEFSNLKSISTFHSEMRALLGPLLKKICLRGSYAAYIINPTFQLSTLLRHLSSGGILIDEESKMYPELVEPKDIDWVDLCDTPDLIIKEVLNYYGQLQHSTTKHSSPYLTNQQNIFTRIATNAVIYSISCEEPSDLMIDRITGSLNHNPYLFNRDFFYLALDEFNQGSIYIEEPIFSLASFWQAVIDNFFGIVRLEEKHLSDFSAFLAAIQHLTNGLHLTSENSHVTLESILKSFNQLTPDNIAYKLIDRIKSHQVDPWSFLIQTCLVISKENKHTANSVFSLCLQNDIFKNRFDQPQEIQKIITHVQKNAIAFSSYLKIITEEDLLSIDRINKFNTAENYLLKLFQKSEAFALLKKSGTSAGLTISIPALKFLLTLYKMNELSKTEQKELLQILETPNNIHEFIELIKYLLKTPFRKAALPIYREYLQEQSSKKITQEITELSEHLPVEITYITKQLIESLQEKIEDEDFEKILPTLSSKNMPVTDIAIHRLNLLISKKIYPQALHLFAILQRNGLSNDIPSSYLVDILENMILSKEYETVAQTLNSSEFNLIPTASKWFDIIGVATFQKLAQKLGPEWLITLIEITLRRKLNSTPFFEALLNQQPIPDKLLTQSINLYIINNCNDIRIFESLIPNANKNDSIKLINYLLNQTSIEQKQFESQVSNLKENPWITHFENALSKQYSEKKFKEIKSLLNSEKLHSILLPIHLKLFKTTLSHDDCPKKFIAVLGEEILSLALSNNDCELINQFLKKLEKFQIQLENEQLKKLELFISKLENFDSHTELLRTYFNYAKQCIDKTVAPQLMRLLNELKDNNLLCKWLPIFKSNNLNLEMNNLRPDWMNVKDSLQLLIVTKSSDWTQFEQLIQQASPESVLAIFKDLLSKKQPPFHLLLLLFANLDANILKSNLDKISKLPLQNHAEISPMAAIGMTKFLYLLLENKKLEKKVDQFLLYQNKSHPATLMQNHEFQKILLNTIKNKFKIQALHKKGITEIKPKNSSQFLQEIINTTTSKDIFHDAYICLKSNFPEIALKFTLDMKITHRWRSQILKSTGYLLSLSQIARTAEVASQLKFLDFLFDAETDVSSLNFDSFWAELLTQLKKKENPQAEMKVLKNIYLNMNINEKLQNHSIQRIIFHPLIHLIFSLHKKNNTLQRDDLIKKLFNAIPFSDCTLDDNLESDLETIRRTEHFLYAFDAYCSSNFGGTLISDFIFAYTIVIELISKFLIWMECKIPQDNPRFQALENLKIRINFNLSSIMIRIRTRSSYSPSSLFHDPKNQKLGPAFVEKVKSLVSRMEALGEYIKHPNLYFQYLSFTGQDPSDELFNSIYKNYNKTLTDELNMLALRSDNLETAARSITWIHRSFENPDQKIPFNFLYQKILMTLNRLLTTLSLPESATNPTLNDKQTRIIFFEKFKNLFKAIYLSNKLTIEDRLSVLDLIHKNVEAEKNPQSISLNFLGGLNEKIYFFLLTDTDIKDLELQSYERAIEKVSKTIEALIKFNYPFNTNL